MKHLKNKVSLLLVVFFLFIGFAPVFGQDMNEDVAEAAKNTAININWMIVGITILLVLTVGMIFDILSKVGDIQKKSLFNWTKINGILALVFLVVGLASFFWELSVHGAETFFKLPSASAHSEEYDDMFMITFWLTCVVFVITHILLFWYTFKYQHSNTRKALYYPDNHKLELIWTIVPAAVLTVLVIRGLIVWNNMTSSDTKDAMNIEVFDIDNEKDFDLLRNSFICFYCAN
jgi:cytochrome c oxidase subunit 2